MPENYRLSHNTVFFVGRDYRITAYNPAYLHFAAANGGRDIARNWGIGSSVLECAALVIRDRLKNIYDQAFAGEIVEFEYHCHSPENFRNFVMRLALQPDGSVVADHALLFEETHKQIVDLEWQTIKTVYQRADGIVLQCCNCRKVQRVNDPFSWDLVRALIAYTADLTVSHGICPVCEELLYPGIGLEM